MPAIHVPQVIRDIKVEVDASVTTDTMKQEVKFVNLVTILVQLAMDIKVIIAITAIQVGKDTNQVTVAHVIPITMIMEVQYVELAITLVMHVVEVVQINVQHVLPHGKDTIPQVTANA